MSDVEELRHSFCPDTITTLFVGESPPHRGTFFFKGNGPLHRNMNEAFGKSPNFLSKFKAKGFFLDDLVLYPINQIKERNERNMHRWKGVSSLAQRLKDYQPAAVVVLMCAIKPMVVDAMNQAGLSSVKLYVTPFPIFPRNVKAFKEKMAEIIPKLPVNGSQP